MNVKTEDIYKFDNAQFYINNKLLTDQFIDEHKDEINWEWLTKHHKLTEEQIVKYSNYVNWKYVWLKQNVSEKFIEIHKDKIENWDWIVVKRNLSIPFVKRNWGRWSWQVISQVSNLDYEFILEFREYIDWRTFTIYHWNDWDESFIREFRDYIDWDYAYHPKRKISNNLRREYVYSFLNNNQKLHLVNVAYSINDDSFKEWARFLYDKCGTSFCSAISWSNLISEKIILNNIEYFTSALNFKNISKKLRKAIEKKYGT